MRSIDFVRNRIRALFKRYEEEEFDLVRELMIEAGYKEAEMKKEGITKSFSSSFFSFLCKELYRICLAEKKIINILYLIKHLPHEEYAYIEEKGKGEGEGYKEIYPGIIIHKEIFYKVLDKLNLNKTKEAYCNYLIVNEEELLENEKYLLNYLSQEQINKFKSFRAVEEILEKEYTEKLKDKQRLILVS